MDARHEIVTGSGHHLMVRNTASHHHVLHVIHRIDGAGLATLLRRARSVDVQRIEQTVLTRHTRMVNQQRIVVHQRGGHRDVAVVILRHCRDRSAGEGGALGKGSKRDQLVVQGGIAATRVVGIHLHQDIHGGHQIRSGKPKLLQQSQRQHLVGGTAGGTPSVGLPSELRRTAYLRNRKHHPMYQIGIVIRHLHQEGVLP